MMRFRVSAAGLAFAIALYSGTVLAAEVAAVSLDAVAEATPLYTVTPPRDFADVKLATAGRASRQAVAVNPKNSNVVVTVFRASGSCWARTSTNAGQTWGASKKLPMLSGKPNCNVPAVMWAPDGSRVYASYSYRIPYPSEPDYTLETGALLSYSTDKGLTWSRLKPVFVSHFAYDHILSLTLAAPLRSGDANWVYLLSDINDGKEGGVTFFNRSADRGQTWSAVQWLESHSADYHVWPSIAGGLGGEVLVVWGKDGYNWDGSRHIEIRRSSDFGRSFSPAFVVRSDTAGDTAVAFGNAGTAHLVYTQRDFYGITGKPMYVYSNKAPYTTWSSPVPLSDDISASGYSAPALSISGCGAASVLHVVWMDDRDGAGEYNTFYTRKVAKNGETWSANMRISDTAVRPTYPTWTVAGIAAGTGTAIGVWGERAAPFSSLVPGPTWASRIAPGVSCP